MNTTTSRARSLSIAILLTTGLTLSLRAATTFTFGSDANTFTMDFVTIGHPGNAADTTGAPNPAGSVPYVYLMGKYEVSRDMINKANAVGNLGITMANMTSYGGNGVNRPATGITWYEAAAFVNWLNTSTGHPAAYNLSGGSLSLWSSAEAWQAGGENLYRHAGAYFFLPSESEWYKAAYYDPAAGLYYDYPTGSDTPPTATSGGVLAGTAVYGLQMSTGPADIANAGGLSPYGTMAQGGNVWEWMETAVDGANTSGSENRGLRSGYWFDPVSDLASDFRLDTYSPASDIYTVGFRVAVIPEPMPSASLIGLAAFGFALWRRRAVK
ncbi:MAG: SUMF1/EgtB/PvdO family nonheme iron enzyme [Verrucomicrobia bacterium]|nr:SUMF1/EgtB/PvdO family nonheme iron enzyme [Verrucomicrobiota bacterium]